MEPGVGRVVGAGRAAWCVVWACAGESSGWWVGQILRDGDVPWSSIPFTKFPFCPSCALAPFYSLDVSISCVACDCSPE